MRYEDDSGGCGEERCYFKTGWLTYSKVYRFDCPPLSKWLSEIPEQDCGTLEKEARRDVNHFRQFWVNSKGQPNTEQEPRLNLTLFILYTFYFSRALVVDSTEVSILASCSLTPRFQCEVPGKQKTKSGESDMRSTVRL